MNEMEKKIAQNIEVAMKCLPEEKRQYFLGFAEGVDNNCRIAPTFGELWDSLKCKLGL